MSSGFSVEIMPRGFEVIIKADEPSAPFSTPKEKPHPTDPFASVSPPAAGVSVGPAVGVSGGPKDPFATFPPSSTPSSGEEVTPGSAQGQRVVVAPGSSPTEGEEDWGTFGSWGSWGTGGSKREGEDWSSGAFQSPEERQGVVERFGLPTKSGFFQWKPGDSIPHEHELADWEGTKHLGSGFFGNVYSTGGDNPYAIKYLKDLPDRLHKKVDPKEYLLAEDAGNLGIGAKMHGVEWKDDEPVKIAMEHLGDSSSLAHTLGLGSQFDFSQPLSKEAEERKLTPEQRQKRLDTMLKVIPTLRKMHENGLSHHDLHAWNVMIGPDGKAKFIDWGLGDKAKGNDYRNVLDDLLYDNSSMYYMGDMLRRGFNARPDMAKDVNDLMDNTEIAYEQLPSVDASKGLVTNFYDKLEDIAKKYGYNL